MLPANLVNLFIRKGLGPESRRVIDNIRFSEPSRRVSSGRGNTSGSYPSKKMGVTIQFESHTVELAAIYEKEHDANVYEYYDQPPAFSIRYQVKGKNRGHMYTPDFFVISEDFIGWEEWKTEEDLIKLSVEKPYLFARSEDGTWHMPPAEQYAQQYGLSFRVRSSEKINWVYLNNIRFLEDYLLLESVVVNEEAKRVLLHKVMEQPGVSIRELLDDQNDFSSDELYKLIVMNELYININQIRITETDKAKVYPNREMALAYACLEEVEHGIKTISVRKVEIHPGNTIQWDGRAFMILNNGETSVALLPQDSNKEVELPLDSFRYLVQKGKITGLTISHSQQKQEAIDILRNTSESELAIANHKYKKIVPILEGYSASNVDVSDRTLRDWVSKYRKAELKYGHGYIGLINKKRRGNSSRRLSQEVLDLMEDHIQQNLETIVNKNAYTVWKLFIADCTEKGYQTPSFTSFLFQLNKRSDYEFTLKREGRKAAYQKQPRYVELTFTTPRHGDYPFEICHLDHTQLDIELKCSKTGKNLGRPWVTFMVDAFTRRILAIYLTFDEPGYRSIMMVLRECVRKHSRLPKNVVVDGGKEFGSIYFETLLAFNNVGKILREGKPKYGSVIERLFGTTNTMFIDNLLGNTQLMKNVRQVTAAVNPKNHAVWTFGKFLEKLKEWAYDIYDTIEHPALGRTPREEFLIGIANFGKRESTYVSYDETFTMLTLPTTKKGTAKLNPGRGVKINHIYYWSESLLDPEFEGKQVPIRYDPFNIGVAYAYIRNTWVYMNSEYYSVFVDRTEREIQQAFEEMKRRMRLRSQEVTITAAKLASFLKSAEAEESLLIQRLRDSEVRSTFTVLQGGKNNGIKWPTSNSKTIEGSSADINSIISNESTGYAQRNSNQKPKSTQHQKPKYKNFGEF